MDQNELNRWYQSAIGQRGIQLLSSQFSSPANDVSPLGARALNIGAFRNGLSGTGVSPASGNRLLASGTTDITAALGAGPHSALFSNLHLATAGGGTYIGGESIGPDHRATLTASSYPPYLWPNPVIPHPDLLLPSSPVRTHHIAGLSSDTYAADALLGHHGTLPIVLPTLETSPPNNLNALNTSPNKHTPNKKIVSPLNADCPLKTSNIINSINSSHNKLNAVSNDNCNKSSEILSTTDQYLRVSNYNRTNASAMKIPLENQHMELENTKNEQVNVTSENIDKLNNPDNDINNTTTPTKSSSDVNSGTNKKQSTALTCDNNNTGIVHKSTEEIEGNKKVVATCIDNNVNNIYYSSCENLMEYNSTTNKDGTAAVNRYDVVGRSDQCGSKNHSGDSVTVVTKTTIATLAVKDSSGICSSDTNNSNALESSKSNADSLFLRKGISDTNDCSDVNTVDKKVGGFRDNRTLSNNNNEEQDTNSGITENEIERFRKQKDQKDNKQHEDTDDTDIDVGEEGENIIPENKDNSKKKDNIEENCASENNKTIHVEVAGLDNEKKIHTTFMPQVNSAVGKKQHHSTSENYDAIDLRTTNAHHSQTKNQQPNHNFQQQSSQLKASPVSCNKKQNNSESKATNREPISTGCYNNIGLTTTNQQSDGNNKRNDSKQYSNGSSGFLASNLPTSPSYMSFDPRILSFYTDEEREKLVQGGWIPPYYSSVLSGFNSNSASTSAAEALAATAAVAAAATTGLLHSVDENYGGNYNHLRIEEKNQGGREGSANNNTAKKEVLSREKKKHIVDKSTAVSATTSTIPVGIAIARKRHDEKEAERGSDQQQPGSSTDSTSQPNRSTVAVTNTTSHGLTSNLVVTGGNSGYWLGHGAYSLPTSTRDGAQLQYNPPPGYKITGDPITGQLFVIPDMTRSGFGPASPQLPSPSRASSSSVKSDQSLEPATVYNNAAALESLRNVAHHLGHHSLAALSPPSSISSSTTSSLPTSSSLFNASTTPSSPHQRITGIGVHLNQPQLQHSSPAATMSLCSPQSSGTGGAGFQAVASPHSYNNGGMSRSRTSSRGGVEDSNRLRVESSPEATTTSSTPPQVRGADSTGGSNAGQRFRSSSRSHGERSNSQSSTPTSTERAGTPSFRNGITAPDMPPPPAGYNPYNYPYYPYLWGHHAMAAGSFTSGVPPAATLPTVPAPLAVWPKSPVSAGDSCAKASISENESATSSKTEASTCTIVNSKYNKATVSVQTISNPVINKGVQTNSSNVVESSVQTDQWPGASPLMDQQSYSNYEISGTDKLAGIVKSNSGKDEVFEGSISDEQEENSDNISDIVTEERNKGENTAVSACRMCLCACHDISNISNNELLAADVGNTVVLENSKRNNMQEGENLNGDIAQDCEESQNNSSNSANTSSNSIDLQHQESITSPQDDGLHILSALASHIDFFTPLTIATDHRQHQSLLSPQSSSLSHSPEGSGAGGSAYNGPRAPYYNSSDVHSRYRYSYQRDRVKTPSDDGNLCSGGSSSGSYFKLGLDTMNPMELEVRMKLAEIQRLYKAKQKQLGKLKPKKDSSDNSQQRRSVGSKGSRRSSKSLSDCDPLSPKPDLIVSPKPPMRKTKAQLKYMPTPPPTMDPMPIENKDSDVEELRSLFEDTFLENVKDKPTERRLSFSSSKVVDFSDGNKVNNSNTSVTSTDTTKPEQSPASDASVEQRPENQSIQYKILSATRRLDRQLESSLLQVTPKHSKSERRKRKSAQNMESSLSNKKRKPGRPKKYSVGVTQTLVSKSAKNNSSVFAFEDKSSSDSDIKREDKDYWSRRRSERIFLSDSISPTKFIDTEKNSKQSIVNEESRVKKGRTHINDLSQKLKKKYRCMDSTRQIKQQVINRLDGAVNDSEDTSNSDDMPLSAMICHTKKIDQSSKEQLQQWPICQQSPQPARPNVKSCKISASDLRDGLSILYFMDGLFYEGRLKEIHPPDVYGVTINGERGNRPHILSREEVLQDVILDVRVYDSQEIPIGSRICAYWSQQFTCMYPGLVVEGVPLPKTARGRGLVNVEFDDGDTGKISVEHVRLLPQDFPIQEDSDDEEEMPVKRRKSMSEELLADSWRERRPAMMEPACNFYKPRPTTVKSVSAATSLSHQSVFSKSTPSKSAKTSVKQSDSSSSESEDDDENGKKIKKRNKSGDKHFERSNSTPCKDQKQKNEPVNVLPAHQIWEWQGISSKRPGAKGKAKKTFFKSIQRGSETIKVGECAVFLTVGRPHLPYIGRVECFYESRGGTMVVKVKWFYHPEETKGGKKLAEIRGALYESPHSDENDVQTISHKCRVMSFTRYKSYRQEHSSSDLANVYYLAGYYDPTISLIKFEGDVKLI